MPVNKNTNMSSQPNSKPEVPVKNEQTTIKKAEKPSKPSNPQPQRSPARKRKLEDLTLKKEVNIKKNKLTTTNKTIQLASTSQSKQSPSRKRKLEKEVNTKETKGASTKKNPKIAHTFQPERSPARKRKQEDIQPKMHVPVIKRRKPETPESTKSNENDNNCRCLVPVPTQMIVLPRRQAQFQIIYRTPYVATNDSSLSTPNLDSVNTEEDLPENDRILGDLLAAILFANLVPNLNELLEDSDEEG